MKKIWDDFRKKRALSGALDEKPALSLNLKVRWQKHGNGSRSVTSPYDIPKSVVSHMSGEGWGFVLGYIEAGERVRVRKISDGVWAEEGKHSHRLYRLLSIDPNADPVDSFYQWMMVKEPSSNSDGVMLALKAIERGMLKTQRRQKFG